MTRKSKKIVLIGILLVAVLLGIIIVKFINTDDKDIAHVEEENSIDEKEEKVYEDKFIDLNIEYLGSGQSSKEKYIQKTVYEDGEECALTGFYVFSSEQGYALEAELWDIRDLDFVLDINEDNYYIVIYGKKICWMQYNPGSMSQFGGVEYRIGVDWESEIEEGTFFFYEIDGDQIERGYLPEEITLEF